MNSQMPVPASDVDKNMNLANPSSSSRIISASVSDKSAAKFAPSIKKCTQYLMGKSAPKSETFTCAICLEDIPEELGILLEECQHKFCRFCLKNVIHFKEKPKAECPYYSCKKQIQVQ